MADDILKPEIISRKEAISKGLRTYFTGKPCGRGHIDYRRTDNCVCSVCARDDLKTWRTDNHDRYRAAESSWRDKNRQRIRSQERARYAANPTKYRQKTRRYYKTNSEDVKAKRREYHHVEYRNADVREAARLRVREWAKEHPEHAKALAKVSRQKRRSREKGSIGSFSAADVLLIRKMQSFKCAYCKKRLSERYHVDHIVALSRGGTNLPSNLQLLCVACNLEKGAKDPATYARSIGLLI